MTILQCIREASFCNRFPASNPKTQSVFFFLALCDCKRLCVDVLENLPRIDFRSIGAFYSVADTTQLLNALYYLFIFRKGCTGCGYSTQKPNITFHYLDYGTRNLIGFFMDFRLSDWILGFQQHFQLDVLFHNPNSEKLYWVSGWGRVAVGLGVKECRCLSSLIKFSFQRRFLRVFVSLCVVLCLLFYEERASFCEEQE